MAFKDITNEFQEAVEKRQSSIPDAKRRKVVKQPKGEDEKGSINKAYVSEAYNVVRSEFLLPISRTDVQMPLAYPYTDIDTDARQCPHGLPQHRFPQFATITPRVAKH